MFFQNSSYVLVMMFLCVFAIEVARAARLGGCLYPGTAYGSRLIRTVTT